MRLLRRPALWAGIVAGVFALTIGGQPFSSLPSDGGDDVFIVAYTASEPLEAALLQAEASAGWIESDVAALDFEAALVSRKAGEGVTLREAIEAVSDPVGGPTEEDTKAVDAALRRPQILTHVVEKGETIARIAARYGIDEDTVLAANDLPNANQITVGQKLNILTVPGAIHTVKQGESLWEIARTYEIDMAEIIAANQIENPNRIRAQQQLIIPGANAAKIGRAIRAEQLVSADGRLLKAFSWPVSGRISSRFGPRWGRMHQGIDIAVNTGTPVKASARGRVSFAGWNGGYGYLVIIDHGNNVETRYAHLSRIAVKVGQYVTRGTVIAYSGNTGNSTGPHLHFEIRYKGQAVNPLNYLQ